MKNYKSINESTIQLMMFLSISLLFVVKSKILFNNILLWIAIVSATIFTIIQLVKKIKKWKWISFQLIVCILYLLSLIIPFTNHNILDVIITIISTIAFFTIFFIPIIAYKKNINWSDIILEYHIFVTATFALILLSFIYGL